MKKSFQVKKPAAGWRERDDLCKNLKTSQPVRESPLRNRDTKVFSLPTASGE
jgi:hypothetical protein